MSASQILLAGHGQEDQWLSDNPNRTYFEAKYNPRVNRSRETYEIPFDNQVTFDSTGRCTIPVKGDYMTRMTLRAVMPPIYPTVPGQYVFPTPSSQVGGTVYVNKVLDLVVADGVTLTANTVGNHYFSIGAQVTLAGTAYVIFDLDGTYTITGIPTANSFTCSTTLAGISYNGTVSSPGIECGDIISYFSTANSNLWVNNLTNKTWQITGGSIVGSEMTFTTSAPSNFPVGSQVILNLPDSSIVNGIRTVTASTDTTFTCTTFNGTFVMGGEVRNPIFSRDNGMNWEYSKSSISSDLTEPTYVSAYGNGTFVMLKIYSIGQGPFGAENAHSIDNGVTWIKDPLLNPPDGEVWVWYDVAYGNGTFVACGISSQFNGGAYGAFYSTDHVTWTVSDLPALCFGIGYGNGSNFVTVGQDFQAYSTDNGVTWTPVDSPLGGYWTGIAYGNGVFVIAAPYSIAYSTDNGVSWAYSASSLPNYFGGIVYGNGVFVATGSNFQAYSIDNGVTWIFVDSPLEGYWADVAYGNGVFVMSGFSQGQAYSTDNGLTWHRATSSIIGYVSFISYGDFSYFNSQSDSVSLVVPPLQLTNRVFSSSNVYPSISFANAADAAFWGFDSREGLVYSLPATPPWTLTQSGWISGFLPPSTSTYDDSVAHKLCKAVRVLVGKQIIKEYSGEYIELQNDLLVPYENKAILKLMNGTLDQTQATVAREYYVNLPIGTKEVPLCALTHQNMSVEIDFDSYLNVSQNLNQGTGDFLDAKSYKTYDASTGLLNGEPINVQTTFSYQQYIFIVTYGGQFIIFDTTKNVDDPTSYIVLSAFSGSSLFSQFCVLSGNLYIGLSDGQLVRGLIDELIQGNISSLELNSYTPTNGSLTGTIVADFRYLYYTVSNTVSSNVFFTRYDTLGSFTSPGSYTTVDFTQTFNSNVTGVYQTLSTGTELILIPQGTFGSLYNFQLNANVQSQWYLLDYSALGYHITEGVLIGSSVYFVDKFNIIEYTNSSFNMLTKHPSVMVGDDGILYSECNGFGWKITPYLQGYWHSVTYGNGFFVVTGYLYQAYSSDGVNWTYSNTLLDGSWGKVVYGNGVFVMTNPENGDVAYSIDNGMTWTYSTPTPVITGGVEVAYGNGVFVLAAYNNQAYSTDNGVTWIPVASPLLGGIVTYGNGVFVMAGYDVQAYSTDDGVSWTYSTSFVTGQWESIAYGNGVFVLIDYSGYHAYSTDNGVTWSYSTTIVPGYWSDVAYGNGVFVAVGWSVQSYSLDNCVTWLYPQNAISSRWQAIAISSYDFTIPGDGFKNLIAVGNYIYCSTNNVAVQIDTSKDLSTAAAYKFPAPLPINQYVFANGPRYVYMFAQGDNTATNIVEFDPYGPNTTLKASILVDYESLPEGTKKPDKALLGLIQTQKVTDMTQMNIKGPVKELWVTGVSATTNVFQYSNLATRSTLELAGEQIVTDDVGTHTFFNVIEPFEAHTAMPIRNFSVLPFEFDPESEIPNGTVNFSRIRDQIFDGDAETVWARTYNLFAIQGGIGNLMYN